MRQVLIKDGQGVSVTEHNKCLIESDGEVRFEPGLNIIKLHFQVDVIAGGDIKFIFKLSSDLARIGLLLAGSEFNGEWVEAIVYNLKNNTIIREEGVVLEASAYEMLKVVPVSGVPAGISLFNSEGLAVVKTAALDAKKVPKKKSRN